MRKDSRKPNASFCQSVDNHRSSGAISLTIVRANRSAAVSVISGAAPTNCKWRRTLFQGRVRRPGEKGGDKLVGEILG